MDRIFAVIVLTVVLLFSGNTGASGGPIFRIASVTPNSSSAISDGTNKNDVDIPISATLVKKGWHCVLKPQIITKEKVVGQIAGCINTNTGAIVGTSIACSSLDNSTDKTSICLDDHDADVIPTTIMMSCVNMIDAKSI